MTKKNMLWLTAAVVVSVSSFCYSKQEKKLTIDWACSDECEKLTELPKFSCLENGTVLFCNPEEKENERTLEILNPETARLKEAVNSKKTLESLSKILKADSMPKFLKWPTSISLKGTSAVYIFDNDIFLLDLPGAEFTRITNSESEEKDVRFSPDGKKIAYVRNNDLYIYDLEKKKETRVTKDGSDVILNGTLSYVYWEEIFGREDTGYWWSDDSNYIAYLKSDQSCVPVVYFVDYKPQTPAILTQRYPKPGQQNPIVHLLIANTDGNCVSQLDSSQTPYEYIARVKWLPDSTKVCVQTLNRDQTKLDMYFMDRDSGKLTGILTEQDPGWVEITDDLYFLRDGKQFIWASQRDGFSHLYLYSIDGQLIRQITKGDWAVCSINGVSYWILSSIAYVDEEKQEIYFGGKMKSPIEQHLYKINFDGTGMRQITEEAGTHRISFCKTGKFYLDVFSNTTTPPSLSLVTKQGVQKALLAESKKKEINELELQYPQLMTVKARDGFEMPALIYTPKDFDPNKKYPAVVYVYGGPGAPTVLNNWQRSIFSDQILLDNEFLVFQFDNRSATNISKTLKNLVIGQMWAECELNDLVDAVKWLKAQSFVDADNIGLWGASGGGSYTLLGLTQTKEFKAGVAIAPVTDWLYYDSIWAEAGMKLPQNNPKGYEKTSLVKRAKDLHGRLLLVHGTYDDNVHPQNAQAFADALIDAGITFDMAVYPMRKHGISDKAAKIHLQKTMLEFWNRNLK